MTIYEEWGFSGSPLSAYPLPGTDLGRKLLVGRDSQLEGLMRRIATGPKLPTLEGANGMGKTSLINVAAFALYNEHITDGRGPLYIPCRKMFQLTDNADLEQFRAWVYTEIAQTLIERGQDLLKTEKAIKTREIDIWINSPHLNAKNFGASFAGWGLQGGAQATPNVTEGFSLTGFRNIIEGWLRDIFPDGQGGVVCTIDNLELVKRSYVARNLLEQLRDDLFSLPGLRWILSGTHGIVNGITSSARLSGYLHAPITFTEIDPKFVHGILNRRIAAYATRGSAFMPIESDDFLHLYNIMHGNLRAVLGETENFCQWVADQRELPRYYDERRRAFKTWLAHRVNEVFEAAQTELSPSSLSLLKSVAASKNGELSTSNFADFGFGAEVDLLASISELTELGLMVDVQSDERSHKRTLGVEPKGWLTSEHWTSTEQMS